MTRAIDSRHARCPVTCLIDIIGAGGSEYRDGVGVEDLVCRFAIHSAAVSLCRILARIKSLVKFYLVESRYEHMSIESLHDGYQVSSSTAQPPLLSRLQHPTLAYLSKSSGERTGKHLQVSVPEGDSVVQRYTSLV